MTFKTWKEPHVSRPQHLRRPSGKAKGGSIVDKDDRTRAAQRDRRADLLAKMRARLAPPVQSLGNTGGDCG